MTSDMDDHAFIPWKWLVGIAMTVILTLVGAWAVSVNATMSSAQIRMNAIEREHAVFSANLLALQNGMMRIEQKQDRLLEDIAREHNLPVRSP